MILALALLLPLKKATLCHSPRCISFGEWPNCPHGLVLHRICHASLTFQWCSLSVYSLPEAALGLMMPSLSSSFKKCSSVAFENCVRECPILTCFLEAPEAAWGHALSCEFWRVQRLKKNTPHWRAASAASTNHMRMRHTF